MQLPVTGCSRSFLAITEYSKTPKHGTRHTCSISRCWDICRRDLQGQHCGTQGWATACNTGMPCGCQFKTQLFDFTSTSLEMYLESVEIDPSVWAPAPIEDTWKKLLALACNSPNCCSHSGNKVVDGILSLTLPIRDLKFNLLLMFRHLQTNLGNQVSRRRSVG